MSPGKDETCARSDLGFSRAQLLDMSDRLGVLYGARTLTQLTLSAVALIQPLFDADFYSAGFTDPKRRRHVAINRPADENPLKYVDRYRELAHQSPMLQYWVRTGDHDRVLRRSDCCDTTRYRDTALFCEVDGPRGLIQHIGTWLRPGAGQHLEVAMGRGGRTDFSKRDVARLAVLRKHIFRAYVNVCDLQRFEQMVNGDAVDKLPPGAVELQDTSLAADVDKARSATPHAAPLTAREREVLRWIVEGKTNPEIGIILGCSWRTVRVHCERIFLKLGVETRTAAAVRAMELGLKL